MEKKPQIVHFQLESLETQWGETRDVVILLDNGKVYRKTSNGGPEYWIEEKWVDDLVEYLGKKEIDD